MTDFSKAVYAAVAAIPRGRVATYGLIAIVAGRPRASRVVGQLLHRNPDPLVPCHRVVFADGSLAKCFAFGGDNVQAVLLAEEGVGFVGGAGADGGRLSSDVKVDLARFLWDGIPELYP